MKTFKKVLLLGWTAPLLVSWGADRLETSLTESLADVPESFELRESASREIAPLQADWWLAFQDEELTRLIEQALERNRDLVASAKRVEQARAALGQARSGLFPQASLEAGGARGQSLDTGYRESDYGSLSGVLGYELDLWGSVRKGAKAAKAEFEAAAFSHLAYRLSISGQVAKTLTYYRATEIEERIVAQSVDTRRTARDLIADRFELGSAAEFDLASAETELANAEADLAEVQQRKRNLAYGLSLLVGDFATGFEEGLASTAEFLEPPSVPAGLPVEVVRSRPDVAAAEKNLQASAERIGVAKAAFYPSIRLTGTAGWESDDLDSVFSSDSRVWSIGPQVYLPLFQGGRNKARLARATSRFEEELALFQQSVLQALQEVQSSLDAVYYFSKRDEANDKAATSARRAATLSQTRYDEGFVSYLEVVDSERTALAAERNRVGVKALKLVATIDLIQALGGGWRP